MNRQPTGDIDHSSRFPIEPPVYNADPFGVYDNLTPLLRARELIAVGETVDDVIAQLRVLFGLTRIDAHAAVSAVILLDEHASPIPTPAPTRTHA